MMIKKKMNLLVFNTEQPTNSSETEEEWSVESLEKHERVSETICKVISFYKKSAYFFIPSSPFFYRSVWSNKLPYKV